MSLQVTVERHHYLRFYNKNALVKSVNETWSTGVLDMDVLTTQNIFYNISEAEESNDLAKMNQVKELKDMKIEIIIFSLKEISNGEDKNLTNKDYLVGMNNEDDD